MPIRADLRQELVSIALAYEQLPRGGRRAFIDREAQRLGVASSTLYRQMNAQVGWESGRKMRRDRGSTRQNLEALQFVGAAGAATVRKNAKKILPTGVAMSIGEANGHRFEVGEKRVNALLRERRMDVKSQTAAAPAVGLRSNHPNHVHQVDPSLCVMYYDRHGQQVIEEEIHYKNKPENLRRLADQENKVWRYVLTDHKSGVIIVWYVSAKGETQKNLFRFLMYAWSKLKERPFHGVPLALMMDPGSANTAHAIRNLLRAMQVELLVNKPGSPRAKGSVENAQNIVETHFESRLRFRPVTSVEELNDAAFAWANAYNANLIPRVEARIQRYGMVPHSRYDLWLRIQPHELRLLPEEALCTSLMLGAPTERKVNGKLEIAYRHPVGKQTFYYDLSGLAGICTGDLVQVSPIVFGTGLITVTAKRYDGEPLEYRLAPIDDIDDYGQRLSAPTIGESFHAHAKTDAEHVGDTLDRAAYGELSADEMERMKKRSNAQPFAHLNDGAGVDSIDYLKTIKPPAYLPKPGAQIDLPKVRTETAGAIESRRQLRDQGLTLDVPSRISLPLEPLGVVEAASRLQKLLGDAWTRDMYARLEELYPNGVMEEDLRDAGERLLGREEVARGHLRSVK